MQKRKIKQEEIDLIIYLLKIKNLQPEVYKISTEVTDYEGAVMRSIGLGKEDSLYEGDIVQVKYIDQDKVPVIITLTKDANNQLLDLDFWKEDFSPLLKYPEPKDLELVN